MAYRPEFKDLESKLEAKHGSGGYRNIKPIADGVHPLTRQLLDYIEEHNLSHITISEAAGYGTWLLTNWRRGISSPNLKTFTDVADVLGFEVKMVLKEK